MASLSALISTAALSLTSLTAVTNLIPALSQIATNGNSILGTLNLPALPDFTIAGNTPLPNGFPWGADTASNTNPYTNPPVTGVTRSYNFIVSRGYIAPDGFNRSVLLVNGAFPGPTIQANWGDTIQVTVNNQISGPEEGTAIHWHGFLQKKTPWFDGVPSVQQCPIAPNASFTYRFQADLYGTSWWHSHYSAQYAGGLSGPIVVYGPKHVPYDIDLGPVLISDWYHTEYFNLVQQTMKVNAPLIPFSSDNNLINGKMVTDCSKVAVPANCTSNAGVSKFKFTSGKTHRLRLINSGAEGMQRFSIDGHNMTVIANDFVPVVPYNTTSVTLGIGQRTDVLVTATGQPTDAVWMRANISNFCSFAIQPLALAAIYYENADTSKAPATTGTPIPDTTCRNDALASTVPYYPIAPPANVATTQQIDITLGKNASNITVWNMNGQTFRANYDHPILLLAKLGNTSYPNDPQWNVYNFGTNTSVRMVIYNRTPAVHPMHIHGHNFWVLHEGPGLWNGTIDRASNPQRRDVQVLDRWVNPTTPSHMVIEFNTDNPGIWPFHCHIAWHVSGGLYINIMERPDLITQAAIPSVMAQTCRDWATYTGHNVVEQIDSGL